MTRVQRFSPTLLMIGALAVIGGSAAALLSVGAPTASPIDISGAPAVSIPLALDLLLGLPVAALIGVAIWTVLSGGGTSTGAKGATVAVVVVVLVLLGAVWVLHESLFPPLTFTQGVGSGGGSGTGSRGTGSGDGGSSGNGGSGNGTGHSGGGNGSGNGSGGGGGTGSGSKNNSTNGTGGGGTNHTGSGNGSGGKGSNGTGGAGGGSGGKNGTGGGATRQPPPPYSPWPVYAAGVAISLLLGAMFVPQLASRWSQRRTRIPIGPYPSDRVAAAQVLSQAAARLVAPTDPRGIVLELYHQLLLRLEPRVGIPPFRTPEEIRAAYLIPLGVRADAAGQLTRVFEEACYSSHPLGENVARLARESILLAEHDLRAVHAIG